MAPSEITDDGQQELYERVYLPIELERERTLVVFEFEVGDKIRHVVDTRQAFIRSFDEKWMEELFEIYGCVLSHPPRYKVQDLLKEKVKGSFSVRCLEAVWRGKKVVLRV